MANEVLKVWQQVLANADRLRNESLRELFNQDKSRAQSLTRTLKDGQTEIVADFSKQLIDQQALDSLLLLAKESKVLEKFAEMCQGAKVNLTEDQPALHTALRADAKSSVLVDGKNVVALVHEELAKVKAFTEKVRGEKKFKTVVNLGIGGSDLGPALIYDALRVSHEPQIKCLFVANVDSTEINLALRECKPEETLFVVCSKSFKTAETLANARIARVWLANGLGFDVHDKKLAEHFVVVSAKPDQAASAGVVAANSFQIWPWVGGRYSIASAMSLAPTLAFGFDVFTEFLAGMRSVDQQMQNTAPENNATLILGLVDVFNFATGRYLSQAILPYSSALRLLPNYLQQLIMESNGKSVRQDGSTIETSTSPVIWGGVGTNSQHAFMQMLHQGTQAVPSEFIGFAAIDNVDEASHDALIANMFAQSKALAFGLTKDEIKTGKDASHRLMPGNRPSTTLIAKTLDARTLGALIAMYEHRVFVFGVITQINSFDQWGVELGKTLSIEISHQINDETTKETSQSDSAVNDSSTKSLIGWYRQSRKSK
ncbi:MAG: glucose-6-phosphate isomerase [Ilumatobacteraceae bacterium]|jgi:glucose-6-phosphate isomerase|nr:glucose-6-phosphate isomerase [Ilumatobacteraceae bacterium]